MRLGTVLQCTPSNSNCHLALASAGLNFLKASASSAANMLYRVYPAAACGVLKGSSAAQIVDSHTLTVSGELIQSLPFLWATAGHALKVAAVFASPSLTCCSV